jgi:TonB family protein
VGVLEAFSTQSYAFTEDKMELLGRLAGLAEAAWARGAVTEDRDTVVGDTEVEDTEVRDREAGAATVEIEALVEAPLETTPALPVPVPLAKVREVFAAVPRDDPFAGKKWRYAAMAGLTLLVLTLASWYGWKAWYKASVASRASHSAASPQGSPTARQNPAGAGFAGTPDVVRPESRPRPGAGSAKSGSVRPASSPVVPGVSVQRRPRSAQSRDGSGTDSSGSSPTQADAVDAPQIAASSADPADLGKVLSASPTLPKLGVPISQGVSGGVLLHKVQPVYPPEARRTRLEGSVVLDAMVTVKGEVDDLKLVSGDPMLAQAAMDAVRQWRYSPYSLNGTPIPKPTRITISFIAPQ